MYVPEAAPVEAIPLRDALTQRGGMLPAQVVVSKETMPGYRTAETAPVQPEGLPGGFVPGQVHTPDYSALDR